jgi:hypothetical protein
MKLQNVIHILIGIVCIGLLPGAKAVVPPPPGGYPNFTTAAGDHALQTLTSGVANTGIGTYSLFSIATGSYNTAIGAGTLLLNRGDDNTATGALALLSNTTGSFNTANGYGALYNSNNDGNTATGCAALYANTWGYFNTANGVQALNSNTQGYENTAIGAAALLNNTTGSGNIAVGSDAGLNISNGYNNIDIGNPGVDFEAGTIRLGTVGTHLATFIAGISGATVTGTAVVVNSSGQLGVAPSSARFKDAIKPMGKASEGILAFKPVTFRYKKDIDPDSIPQFGLVAEEVEKVNRDLVVHDTEGKPYTVRYDAVNAMLLNEFLKEHKKTEKLEAAVASLIATVKEQSAQIQKVSAQLEASKPVPQVVNNP